MKLSFSSKVILSFLYSSTAFLLTQNSIAAVTAKMWLPSKSLMFLTGGMKSLQSQQQLSQNYAISKYPLLLATDVTMWYNSWNYGSLNCAKLLISSQQFSLSCLSLKITLSCRRQNTNLLQDYWSLPYFWMYCERQVSYGVGGGAKVERVEERMRRKLMEMRRSIVVQRMMDFVRFGRFLSRYLKACICLYFKYSDMIMIDGDQQKFLSTPAPQSVTSPWYCFMCGLVHPPKAWKSEKEGLLSQ